MRAFFAAAWLLLGAAAHDDAVALLQLAQPPAATVPEQPASGSASATELGPSAAAIQEPPLAAPELPSAGPSAAAIQWPPMVAPELPSPEPSNATEPRPSSNATTAQEFAVGDFAYVRIVEGPLAGRVLPCMIKGRKLAGKYHIRVFSAPLSQDLPMVSASYLSKLDAAGAEDAVKNFQADEKATVLMRQLSHEAGLRLRGEWVARGLNTSEVQRKLKAIKNKMMQDVELEARSAGCPANFHMRRGTSRTVDRLESPGLQDAIEGCKQACDNANATGCRSFQWSPNAKECILVKADGPKWERTYKDFIYCAVH